MANVLIRQPQNADFIQPTKYLLTFDRIGTSQYFCQEANIPGISLKGIDVVTPVLDYHAAGTKITYNEFVIRFLIDEKAQSWIDLYNWFRAIASPENFEERRKLTDIQNRYKSSYLHDYSDAVLTILSGLNNPLIRIQFINLFPISLSDIKFDTKESAHEIQSAEAVFYYEYFNFL